MRARFAGPVCPSCPMDEIEKFRDDFTGKLSEGWSWVREDADLWRFSSENGLVMHTIDGGMWADDNIPPRNILVRSFLSSDQDFAANQLSRAVEVSVALRPVIWGYLFSFDLSIEQ